MGKERKLMVCINIKAGLLVKPCAACRSPYADFTNDLFSGRPDQAFQIQCPGCGIAGPATHNENTAIECWNFMQEALLNYEREGTI